MSRFLQQTWFISTQEKSSLTLGFFWPSAKQLVLMKDFFLCEKVLKVKPPLFFSWVTHFNALFH